MKHNNLLIVVSAILFFLSFFSPPYFWVFVFIFLIPIFYLALEHKLSFLVGLLWGFVFYFLSFYGFVVLFLREVSGRFVCGIPILLAAYCSFYVGIWFWLLQKIALVGKGRRFFLFLFMPIVSLFYFYWMHTGSFWIFGQYIGYPFVFPLLPLLSHPSMLSLLPCFGSYTLLLLVCSVSLFFAAWIVMNKRVYLVFSFISILPFLYGVIWRKQNNIIPPYVHTVGYVAPPDYGLHSRALDSAQEIYGRIIDLLHTRSEIQHIVMPESCYRFALNERPDIVELLSADVTTKNINFFVGSPRQGNKKIYNSLYWIKNGQIMSVYDKTVLVAFAEWIPSFWQKIPYAKQLFLHEHSPFSHGDTSSDTGSFSIDQDLIFEPYICSDVFLGKEKAGASASCPILLVVNDAIFALGYMRNIMFLYAKFVAICQQRDLLYVGYSSATWCDRNGSMILLS